VIFEARILELRSLLEHHNKLYYQDGVSEITDAEYDLLFRELEDLEKANPEFHDPNSPTLRVGGAPLEAFVTKPHLLPMLSIDDVFEESEVVAFYDRIKRTLSADDVAIIIEPKIDGVACSLVYRAGQLEHALTRGDGSSGDDITTNVRTIRSIPLKLRGDAVPELFEVRGEIFMPTLGFAKLNEEREEAGLQVFANPRNATAGTLKLLDSKEVAKRPLEFLAHGLGAHQGIELASEEDFHQLLDQFGIRRNGPLWNANSLPEILDAIRKLDEERHGLAHGTDGAVLKVVDFEQRETLGFTSRAPRWAAAFKYPPEQKETLLKAITIQVGRTGVLTPVAELEPVLVSGTVVSRATLHNQEEIERKDVRIGDTVLIEKAGEIIPSIVKVITKKRPESAQPYHLPSVLNHQCPSCAGPIESEEGFVAWRCTSFACPAQAVTRIKHFAQRKALDLDGLGESVAIKLVETGLASSPLDLFSLTESDLAGLMLDPAKSDQGIAISKERRFGHKRAATMLTSIQRASDQMPLSRWLFAMGISHIGESSSKELSRLHQRLSELPHSPIIADLAGLPDFDQLAKSKRKKENHPGLAEYQIDDSLGPVAAQSLLLFFRSEAGQTVLQKLADLKIDPVSDNYAPKPLSEATNDFPFVGKTFVLTGALSAPRSEFKKLIESLGGKVSSSISSKTDYLLAGEGGGSKRIKAESLQVEIIDEEHFEKLSSSIT